MESADVIMSSSAITGHYRGGMCIELISVTFVLPSLTFWKFIVN